MVSLVLILGASSYAHAANNPPAPSPVLERYTNRLYKPPHKALQGTLLWQPSVETSYHVTDNVRASALNRQSDAYVSVVPSLRVETPRDAIYGFQGLVQAEQQLYNHFSAQNQQNGMAWLAPFYRVSRDWLLTGLAKIQRSHELTNFESTQPLANSPTPFNHAHLQFQARHDNARVGQDITVSFQRLTFNNTNLVTGGRLINDDRNRSEYLAGLEMYIKGGGHNRAGWRNEILSQHFDRRDFNIISGAYDGINRDHNGLRSQMTFQWDATSVVRLSGAMGAEYRRFQAAQWNDRIRPVGSLQIRHHLTGLTDLELQGEQSVQTTAFDNAAAFTARTVTASIKHELRRNIILDVSGTAGTSDYWDNSRKDTLKGARVATHYQQNDIIDWRLAYQFQARDSSFNLADYHENNVTLSARIQF